MMADDLADSPEAIARGQRYLAWSAGLALLFVLLATIIAHVAAERHERAVSAQNREAFALAIGTDMARQFPMP